VPIITRTPTAAAPKLLGSCAAEHQAPCVPVLSHAMQHRHHALFLVKVPREHVDAWPASDRQRGAAKRKDTALCTRSAAKREDTALCTHGAAKREYTALCTRSAAKREDTALYMRSAAKREDTALCTRGAAKREDTALCTHGAAIAVGMRPAACSTQATLYCIVSIIDRAVLDMSMECSVSITLLQCVNNSAAVCQ